MGRAIEREVTAAGLTVAGTTLSPSSGRMQLDVSNRADVESAVRSASPRAVVHLARPYGSSAREIDDSVSALRHLASCSARMGVTSLVFASSSAVYGDFDPRPLAETSVRGDLAGYAALKRKSELALEEVRAASGLATVALRIFNVYGPGFSNSLVNRLAIPTATEATTTVTMDARFVRDYIHVEDVARAFAAAISAGKLAPHVANVGTGIGTSNLELVALLPDAQFERAPAREHGSWSIADPTVARRALGLSPEIALATALRDRTRYLGAATNPA